MLRPSRCIARASRSVRFATGVALDQHKFDDLAKLFAASPSRRRFIKGAAAALAASLFGTVLRDEDADRLPEIAETKQTEPRVVAVAGAPREFVFQLAFARTNADLATLIVTVARRSTRRRPLRAD